MSLLDANCRRPWLDLLKAAFGRDAQSDIHRAALAASLRRTEARLAWAVSLLGICVVLLLVLLYATLQQCDHGDNQGAPTPNLAPSGISTRNLSECPLMPETGGLITAHESQQVVAGKLFPCAYVGVGLCSHARTKRDMLPAGKPCVSPL